MLPPAREACMEVLVGSELGDTDYLSILTATIG